MTALRRQTAERAASRPERTVKVTIAECEKFIQNLNERNPGQFEIELSPLDWGGVSWSISRHIGEHVEYRLIGSQPEQTYEEFHEHFWRAVIDGANYGKAW